MVANTYRQSFQALTQSRDVVKLPDMEASPTDDPRTQSAAEVAYLKWKSEQEAMLENKGLCEHERISAARSIAIGLLGLFWAGVCGNYANLPKLIDAVKVAEGLWPISAAWGGATFIFLFIAGIGMWAGWGTVVVVELLAHAYLSAKRSRLYWLIYGREPSLLTLWIAWVAVPVLCWLALVWIVLWSVATRDTLFDRAAFVLVYFAALPLWGMIALAALGLCVLLLRLVYQTTCKLISWRKSGN